MYSGGFVLLLHFLFWVGQVLRPPKPRRKWGGSTVERSYEKFCKALNDTPKRLSGKRWRKRQRALRLAHLLHYDKEKRDLFSGPCYYNRAAIRSEACCKKKKQKRFWRLGGGYHRVDPNEGFASAPNELFRLDKRRDENVDGWAKQWADSIFGEDTYREDLSKPSTCQKETTAGSSMSQKETSPAVSGAAGSIDDWCELPDGFAYPSSEVFRVEKHDENVLDELVKSIDDPSKVMAPFLAMTPAQYAKNVEALLLRANFAELLFNESSRTLDPQLQECPSCPRDKNSAATQGPPTDSKYFLTPTIVDTGASFGLTPFDRFLVV